MKRIFLFAIVLLISCNNARNQRPALDSMYYADLFFRNSQTGLNTIVHFECLNNVGETDSCWQCGGIPLGSQPYIIRLAAGYKTDTSLINVTKANLEHAARICNGSSDTNHLEFPYVRYLNGINNFDTWVYYSKKNIPAEPVDSVKAFMVRTWYGWMADHPTYNKIKTLGPAPSHDAAIKIAISGKWVR